MSNHPAFAMTDFGAVLVFKAAVESEVHGGVFNTDFQRERPAVTLPECSTWNIVSNCCMATGFREPHSMKSRKGSTGSTRPERTSSRPWGWIHGMALPDGSQLPRG